MKYILELPDGPWPKEVDATGTVYVIPWAFGPNAHTFQLFFTLTGECRDGNLIFKLNSIADAGEMGTLGQEFLDWVQQKKISGYKSLPLE